MKTKDVDSQPSKWTTERRRKVFQQKRKNPTSLELIKDLELGGQQSRSSSFETTFANKQFKPLNMVSQESMVSDFAAPGSVNSRYNTRNRNQITSGVSNFLKPENAWT
jgi:hypothetical protein